jgi:hypothetical protein
MRQLEDLAPAMQQQLLAWREVPTLFKRMESQMMSMAAELADLKRQVAQHQASPASGRCWTLQPT